MTDTPSVNATYDDEDAEEELLLDEIMMQALAATAVAGALAAIQYAQTYIPQETLLPQFSTHKCCMGFRAPHRPFPSHIQTAWSP
jgi:hypothetical protein